MATMVTTCCNLIKIGGGGGRVARKYHDTCTHLHNDLMSRDDLKEMR